jgi:hypothetical protein
MRPPFHAQIENDLLSREQQLIFGLIMLNRRYHMLREEGYAYYLRELLKVTEFSADEAKETVNKYKNNPEKWTAVLQDIRSMLTVTGTENNE